MNWLKARIFFTTVSLIALQCTASAATLLYSGTALVKGAGNQAYAFLDVGGDLTSPGIPPHFSTYIPLVDPPIDYISEKTTKTFTLRVTTPSTPISAQFSNDVFYYRDFYSETEDGKIIRIPDSDNAGVGPMYGLTPTFLGNLSTITFDTSVTYIYDVGPPGYFPPIGGGQIFYSYPTWVQYYAELPVADLGKTFSFELFAGTVPEPSTWVMMILGFGYCGAMIRRRRSKHQANPA